MKYERYFKNIASELIRDLTAFGNPAILLIISILILGVNRNILFIILGLLLTEFISGAIKFFYHKERPNKEEHSNILERLNARSFPSLHSARSAFVFVTFFALSDNIYLKILFLMMPIIIGITRILLKKHYLIDVIAGYILGSCIFFLWKFSGFF